MPLKEAIKTGYKGGKVLASDLYNAGKSIGGDTFRGLSRVGAWAGDKTGTAYKASARALYEHGRLRHLHTSNRPVFFDESPFRKTTSNGLISVAIPARIDGRLWRAPKTPKVWDLYGSNYPGVFVELEDPNPNLEGEEAIRLTVHGDARSALGSADVAWRMWMPGKYAIKVDAQGSIIEKPQGEMTAGDVVSLLADTVQTESGGRLCVSHRDLHLALMKISERSGTLEKRWQILEERLKFNMHLVNKPEEVAGLVLSMVVLDTQDAKNFVRDLRNGKVTGWSSLLDRVDGLPLRVYGSFASLLGEGQRMLPTPNDPSRSFRVPASVVLGNFNVLYFVNRALENESLRPQVRALAGMTIENQSKALEVGKAILKARGEGFDEATRRIKVGSHGLVKAVGDRTDIMLKRLESEMAAEIDAGHPVNTQISSPNATGQTKQP